MLQLRRPFPAAFSANFFEALEARALLTAPTATYVSHTTDGTALFVDIDYHADQGLDLTTLGAGDIVLSMVGRPSLTGTLFNTPTTLPNGDTRAVYIIDAYAGAWNFTHSGTYDITSPPGQVQDLQGTNLASTEITQITLTFSTPRVQLVDVSTVNSDNWLIVVRYTDDTAIDTTTLGDADITVAGAGIFSGIKLWDVITTSASDVTAVYRIPAPKGTWNFANTGTTVIPLANNQISDTSGNFIPNVPIGSFYLWFDKPAADVQPTAIDGYQWLIPVTYSGLSAIDGSSIASGDVQVTAANGYTQAGTLISNTDNGDGTFTATYRVIARGGTWDFTDNDLYSVSILANRVHDNANRFAGAGNLHTFGLWFNNPAAEMALPTAPTLHQWDIAIDFSDNGTLDLTSITSNSIRVVAPGGNLTVSLLSIGVGPGNSTRATFRLTSDAGLANGHYEVWTNANQVHDTENSFAAEGSLASFWLWFQ